MTKEKKTSDSTVKLANVRLAFGTLFQARAVNGEGEPKFSASLIIDKKQKDVIAAVEAAMLKAATAKWGAKAAVQLKALQAADKCCLHDGDLKTEYDGFEGNLYVSARATVKPRVVDRRNQELTQADGIPYNGCYVNATVDIYAQDNSFGKRINATLRGVQFVKDGEAFGAGRPAGDDEFEELEDEEGDLA